ncbi:MAG: prephenate dehydrogenase [Clostridium sp.]
MQDLTVGFIGLGLIGGSIARGLKRSVPHITIMAYMRTRETLIQAKKEGTIDVILDGIDGHLSSCDIIFLCTPVEYNSDYLLKIKLFLKKGAIVTDVGSTKTNIHETVAALHMEEYFIGGHPMAGSEKTGYENSSDHLLENTYYIITPTQKTSPIYVERLMDVAKSIGAIPVVMDYKKHDFIVAAISHLPHIVASSLVNLVHDSDDENENMKRLAAGGFKDITRIASASPVMWEQICMTNSDNISVILERYIQSLQQVLEEVQQRNSDSFYDLFESSKNYRNSFSDHSKGSVTPDYSFSVDIIDEPGAIAIISAILSGKGISIKNIGISHNREHGEGALRITFYDEEALTAAHDRLKDYNYTLLPG